MAKPLLFEVSLYMLPLSTWPEAKEAAALIVINKAALKKSARGLEGICITKPYHSVSYFTIRFLTFYFRFLSVLAFSQCGNRLHGCPLETSRNHFRNSRDVVGRQCSCQALKIMGWRVQIPGFVFVRRERSNGSAGNPAPLR